MKTFVMNVSFDDSVDAGLIGDALIDFVDGLCACKGDSKKECSLMAASVTSRQHSDDEFVDYDIVIRGFGGEDDDETTSPSESADEG